MIFVNFKTFKESAGDNGLHLLDLLGQVSGTTKVPIIPVVQALDLGSFIGKTLLPLWVQHIDPVTYGAHTGSVIPEEVIRLQAKGTLLNHSENPISLEVIEESIKRAKEVQLKTLVFANDIQMLSKVIKLRPDYVSYEPAELVGSTTVSVSEAKPEVIYEAGELCKNAGIPLIVGAGIHSTQDVKVALEQGGAGIAVATDIVKAEDPKSRLIKLLEGFN